MFSLVINNLWRTAEAGGGWLGWDSSRNPVVDWVAFTLSAICIPGMC